MNVSGTLAVACIYNYRLQSTGKVPGGHSQDTDQILGRLTEAHCEESSYIRDEFVMNAYTSGDKRLN